MLTLIFLAGATNECQYNMIHTKGFDLTNEAYIIEEVFYKLISEKAGQVHMWMWPTHKPSRRRPNQPHVARTDQNKIPDQTAFLFFVNPNQSHPPSQGPAIHLRRAAPLAAAAAAE